MPLRSSGTSLLELETKATFVQSPFTTTRVVAADTWLPARSTLRIEVFPLAMSYMNTSSWVSVSAATTPASVVWYTTQAPLPLMSGRDARAGVPLALRLTTLVVLAPRSRT